MTTCERTDQAIQILARTRDGSDLAPQHLRLVQAVVNKHANALGLEAFATLHEQVTAGTYVKPWFHGHEHLTKNHLGTVSWRGQSVDHFAFKNQHAEAQAAADLAKLCIRLESVGLTPTGSMRFAADYLLPLGEDERTKPWVQPLAKKGVHSLLEREVDGVKQAVILFWSWAETSVRPVLAGLGADNKNRAPVLCVDPTCDGNTGFGLICEAGAGLGLLYQLQADRYALVGSDRSAPGDVLRDAHRWIAWTGEYGFTPALFEHAIEAADEHVAKTRPPSSAERTRVGMSGA